MKNPKVIRNQMYEDYFGDDGIKLSRHMDALGSWYARAREAVRIHEYHVIGSKFSSDCFLCKEDGLLIEIGENNK